tara:strand:+ start:66 stop:212 length:147 start_codon:yes stop_codon:yes gene_type:complete
MITTGIILNQSSTKIIRVWVVVEALQGAVLVNGYGKQQVILLSDRKRL